MGFGTSAIMRLNNIKYSFQTVIDCIDDTGNLFLTD